MTNNDILRTLRYALELGDPTVLAIFRAAGVELEPVHLSSILKRDDEPGFEPLSDERLGQFLDAFVDLQRGKREPAAAPARPMPMSNNRVLRSLKIALELKDTDVIAIMKLAGVEISKSEVSALFRREGHTNYKPCGNQFLRNFLRGLGMWHRAGAPAST